MFCRFLASTFLRSFRGYHCLAETYKSTRSLGEGARHGLPSVPTSQPNASCIGPAEQTMRSLFDGYHPTFKRHLLGCEVEALLLLSPSQQMCYYEGKLFGGYVTLLLDRILADCCRPPDRVVAGCGPAFTAYLNTSFLLPVPPNGPILLRAWPEKVDGRKIFLKGCVQIPGKAPSEWLDAITAESLFIRPKGQGLEGSTQNSLLL